MGKKRKRRSPRAVVLIMALLLLPAAAVLGFFGWQELQLASASERSTCDVLGVGSMGGAPWVILVHTVAGERYERKDLGPAGVTGDAADALIEGLRPGARVECRYPAGKPSLVVYFERDPLNGQMQLAGSATLLLLIAGAFFWARRQPGWKRKKGD